MDKFFGGNRLMSDVLPKKNLSDSKPLKVHFTFVISNIFDIVSFQVYVIAYVTVVKYNDSVPMKEALTYQMHIPEDGPL